MMAKGIVTLLMLSFVLGCGGGGSDPVVGGPWAGIWQVHEVSTTDNPGDGCGGVYDYAIRIDQVGDSLTIWHAAGPTTGTVNGAVCTVDVPYSYPEGGGTTTVSAATWTLTDLTSGTGTQTWTWVGNITCTGTSEMTLTR